MPDIPLTVFIATRNEEANIERCLKHLSRVRRVVLLDSGSTDKTVALAQQYKAEVIDFKYAGGYPKKRQWAIDQVAVDTDWTLLLDADEIIPDALWDEIDSAIKSAGNTKAFLIKKGFHFLGKKFRFGGFSHQAVLLFRTGFAKFEQLVHFKEDELDMEVHERVIVDGPIDTLKTPLIHEDFKGLASYIRKHNQYSSWEAHVRHQFLSTGKYGEYSLTANAFGNVQERRRFVKGYVIRIPFEPVCWFIYHYFIQLGFLEGYPGLVASTLRMHYISSVRAKVFELNQKKLVPKH